MVKGRQSSADSPTIGIAQRAPGLAGAVAHPR
jgi:hypothetical protein